MKIAILAFSSLPKMGGAEIFTHNLIQHLLKRGHEVHLFLPRSFHRKFKALDYDKRCQVHPLLFREMSFVNRFPAILNRKLLSSQKKYNFDAWQVIGVHPTAHITRSISKVVPVAVRAFGADIQIDESISYGFRLRLPIDDRIKKTLQTVSACVALTPSLIENFKEFDVPDEKIYEIPNGVSLERFAQNVDRDKIRQELNVQEDEKLILSTGRYHIKKGYEYIPEAARILLDKGCKFKWLIVGKNMDKIAELIQKFDVANSIILKNEIGVGQTENCFNAPSDDLIELYKSADIYALPSLIEGMSNAMLEALAAGLPVVTADAPGCRDLIKHELNGLLCKVKDSNSLAEQLEKLLTSSETLNTLKQQVNEYIMQHSWEIIGDKYIKMFEELKV